MVFHFFTELLLLFLWTIKVIHACKNLSFNVRGYQTDEVCLISKTEIGGFYRDSYKWRTILQMQEIFTTEFTLINHYTNS